MATARAAPSPAPASAPESGDFGSGSEVLKKKKKTSKYNYTFGDRYPGNNIGHKSCLPISGVVGLPVPCNMGWLWNATDTAGWKCRRGWRPGALGKSVARVMTFKLAHGTDTKPKSKKKRRGGGGAAADEPEEPEPPLVPKPTMKINRKGDVFTIQVNPLKDLNRLGEAEDPYVDCDPLVFKIIKKRSPDERARMEAKKLHKLKKERDEEIKRQLSEAAEDICKCAYMDVFCNDYSAIDPKIEQCPAFVEPPCVCKDESISSLSSNASWDIEYTPPFGCFDTQPQKIKNFVHVDTQYDPVDVGIDPNASKPSKPAKTSKGKSGKSKGSGG